MAARWPAGPEPMTNKSYVYSGTSSCPFGAYHAPCVSLGEDVSTAVFEDTELGRAQRLQSVGVVQPCTQTTSPSRRPASDACTTSSAARGATGIRVRSIPWTVWNSVFTVPGHRT